MVQRRTSEGHAGTWIVLACFVVGAVAATWYVRGSEPEAVEPAARAASDAARPASAEPGSPGPSEARAARSGAAAGSGSLEPDELELSPTDPRPGDRAATHERAAYLAFLADEARAPGSLDARAAELLSGPEPAAVKLAFLRARLERRTPGRLDGFLDVVRSKTQLTTPMGESLAEAAVRFLGETAKEDPGARDMIRRIAFEEQPIASQVRVRAAQAFARCATGSDLSALERHLASETDSRLLAGALHGLAENPDADQARRVAEQLGLSLSDFAPAADEDREP
ncbi:MAG: hypothetical protein IT453_19695 [Planctomycetes bacterium]|nr:hypothetical protein [Planctomycetota bacterium]